MKQISKFINESVEDYPNVLELGEGEFEGALWGHCFAYEGKKYYSDYGWKNIFPMKCRMEVKEGKSFPYQIDKYQRPELKKLYDD